tara:strand:- start:90 stop:344 length:255 start_codon:yes stop_codon:yes gene_type:complete
MSKHNGITVQVQHDMNQITDRIAANVSIDLASAINRKILGEVCENMFGTADMELVRDTFEAIRLDPKIQDRVLAIRAARRIGVK